MNSVHLLAACTALIVSVPVPAAPTGAPSPAVEMDTQCLLLYLAAAGDAKDDKAKEGAIAGSWYFLGRLDVAAPGLDLVQALRAQAAAVEGNPQAKEIASACDSQLSARGARLMDIGKQLLTPPASTRH